MAKSPLILAALAKDAVPQLNFTRAVDINVGSGQLFDSALLTATDGNYYVVKQASSPAAGLILDTEVAVLRAIAPYRAHLPFATTQLVGAGKDARGRRVHIFSFVHGEPINLHGQGANSPLISSLANALAAIHALPVAAVESAGLPTYDNHEILQQNVATMDKLAQTGRVPAILLNRWERAFEDVNLWKFQPSVIHKGFWGHNLLVENRQLTGILGWHTLGIGDPAVDFAWILSAAGEEFAYSLLLEYENLRGSDANLRTRARLYSEMLLGETLMQDLQYRDEPGIASSEAALADLAADVESGVAPDLLPRLLGTDFAPAEFTLEATGQDLVSDEYFAPVPDASYDHRELFGETGAIPVAEPAPASEPMGATPAASLFDAPAFLSDVDDATAPITLPPATPSKETGNDKELF